MTTDLLLRHAVRVAVWRAAQHDGRGEWSMPTAALAELCGMPPAATVERFGLVEIDWPSVPRAALRFADEVFTWYLLFWPAARHG